MLDTQGKNIVHKEQVNQLNRILSDTKEELTDKYIKGAKEHKTILSLDYTPLELVEMAFEEALDMVTYIHTLREALREQVEEQ